MILKGYIFAILYGLVCLAVSLLAYKLGLPKKYSRKLVHICIGFEWVILSHYMGATYHFLIVCILFTLLLMITHFKKLMPMISSESDNAPGTVYYGVAMTVMAIICLFEPRMMLPFGIGVFCTSLGDGFAGVIGQLIKKINPRIYENKTLWGTVANLVFSFLTPFVISKVYGLPLGVLECIYIAALSVGLETVTPFGLDNLSTTLGTSFFAYALIFIPDVQYYIVPIIITPIIIAVVKEKNVLSKMGVFCAVVLDLVVSLTLGNVGFLLLLAFLVLSVITDKIKKHRKSPDLLAEEKDSRNHIQVVANGLIPMMMAILFSITVNRAFLVGYVASLAEAFSDTAASGFGAFSRRTFDLFKMKKCKAGISGGMSVVGTLASLAAAFVMGALSLLLGVVNFKMMLVVSISAFLGAIFDSMLGSLIQIKYRCTVCGELTEKTRHCSSPTKKASGFEFFDNDVVNLFSSMFSAVFAVAVSAWFF